MKKGTLTSAKKILKKNVNSKTLLLYFRAIIKKMAQTKNQTPESIKQEIINEKMPVKCVLFGGDGAVGKTSSMFLYYFRDAK